MTVQSPERAPGRYPLREARARRTLQALIEAASALFADRGYAATTIIDIADRAGVARATVFTAVPGGKPQLLKLARDRALAGDDEDVPIAQRAWFREAMSLRDPRQLLKQQARNYRLMLERAARIAHALEVGAETAEELADLRRTAAEQRRQGARVVVDRLQELGPLADGLDPQTAADTITALNSASTYLLLTDGYGWTADAFEEWLARQLVLSLLPRP